MLIPGLSTPAADRSTRNLPGNNTQTPNACHRTERVRRDQHSQNDFQPVPKLFLRKAPRETRRASTQSPDLHIFLEPNQNPGNKLRSITQSCNLSDGNRRCFTVKSNSVQSSLAVPLSGESCCDSPCQFRLKAGLRTGDCTNPERYCGSHTRSSPSLLGPHYGIRAFCNITQLVATRWCQ